MAELFRSSSMEASVDSLIRPSKLIKPLESHDKKQTNSTVNAAAKKVAPQPKQEEPIMKKSIFTMGSPPRWEEEIRRESSFHACALCHNKIAHHQDRYMYGYGYLQAFCSPECRDDQIALDLRFKPSSPVPKQTINSLRRNLLKVKIDK